MSSHTRESTNTDEDEDGMDVDPESRPAPPLAGPSTGGGRNGTLATVLRDSTNWLSNMRTLRETEVIILITPVVVPISQDPTDLSDPFEPLGRSLARRHARVRQVPYTQRNGITSTHLGFIKRGHVIILCFALRPGQQIQLEFADIAFAVSDNKPCIIVICCSPVDAQQAIPFPTVIQTAGYSPPALEATAALIFGEQTQPLSANGDLESPMDPESLRPKLWDVEQWNEARDMSSVLNLWTQNISRRFSLDQETFASLLRRPGYAKHYVVRDPRSEEILGFCATYLSYVDQEGEKLIASLAILLVRTRSRKQGVGLSLHQHAIGQLRRTRGVVRLQLGSTFPRILYGPPLDMQLNEEWFRRRGWQLNKEIPGQGQVVHDLLLNFEDWRYTQPESSSSPQYRLCTQDDMVKVLAMVDETATRRAKMGWFDQYSSLMNGPNVKDIVLGVENNTIIAAALTYTPGGSQIASNLPWAGRIGDDVGGATCICISSPRQDTVMVGLLDICVKNLQAQGMRRMFLDGVAQGLDDLRLVGFKEWARYRDVWKDT